MIKDYTTTTVFEKDLDYFKKLKEKGGYASIRVVLSKVVSVIKAHKFEDEI